MLGVDLSNNNGTVNYAAVVRAARFVYHKASEGRTFTDRLFVRARHDAREAGLRFGAYHFARPDLGNSPEAEARHFCNMIGQLFPGELRPALDLEVSRPKPHYTEWARSFNRYVKNRLGVWPLFYSYPYYIQGLHPVYPIGGGLWLASYGPNDGQKHSYSVPEPWKLAIVHQFTSNGRIPGVMGHADLNHAESLRGLIVG